MKKVIAFVLLILGVVLMNSPPTMNQDFTTDVDLEMITSIDMNQDFGIIAMDMEAPVQGGTILQTFSPTWSATMLEDVEMQSVIMQKRLDGLIYSMGNSMMNPTMRLRPETNFLAYTYQKEGPLRLEIYEANAIWRYQGTCM